MVVGGRQFRGFGVTAGVRQGCPLFPFISATAAELLLRRLRFVLPVALARAYANDLALVFSRLLSSGPTPTI
eukprot:11226225-Lingulodinium_polyedra.AAC.1